MLARILGPFHSRGTPHRASLSQLFQTGTLERFKHAEEPMCPSYVCNKSVTQNATLDVSGKVERERKCACFPYNTLGIHNCNTNYVSFTKIHSITRRKN